MRHPFFGLLVGFIAAAILLPMDPASAQTKTAATIPASAPATIDARPWPRSYTIDGTEFSIYRPQLDAWTDNKAEARAVMSVKTGTTTGKDGKTVDKQAYGVLWLTARTETDRDAREVTFADLAVSKVSFPTAKAKEPEYLALVRKITPATDLVASLDEMESALALSGAKTGITSVAVNNDPPEIIFSFEPSVLALIDGEPAWKPSGVAGVERVVNTRALLLRYQNHIYLGYGGHWATAAAIAGPYAIVAQVPASLDEVQQKAVAANQAPAAKDVPPDIAADFRDGKFPQVYIRSHPAELITIDGAPQFAAITNTTLTYVSNTPSDVVVDHNGEGAWYVLISGRWFTASSTKGPWTYLASTALPAEFAKIPSDGPKGAVLASIAGTPEAKEAMIANAIPQTATVDITKASFQSKYDGAPRFVPITGTSLAYALNSATPIIEVPGASYYALSSGVWFRSERAEGPWAVATTVPTAIYSIPASSPVHYVTYARVYGSSGNLVYVGYTPGYYGTVVSNDVVVYGSGYSCNSWVGEVWYGCPSTYGYGAAFAYGASVGWALSFGWGWYDPWYDPWWGPWAGYWPGYYYPWAYGGAVAANVYGRWGNSVVAGTAAAWANPWTGNYGRAGGGGFVNPVTGGRGYGYAGRNTNIYTGQTTGAAAGVRYNPETGRAVAGAGASTGNIYTGNGAAAGGRTVVNTDTGQVTREAGGAVRTDRGATAAGGFATSGQAGNAAGKGYIHYNNATGDVSRGGAAVVNGDLYAGKDGNVYKHDSNGWEKAGNNNNFTASNQNNSALDRERAARDRGVERSGGSFDRGGSSGRSFDRGSYGSHYSGRMGGGRGGGGFRGGRR